MKQITIDLPALHPAQATANDPARFVIYNCGRRFGKDILMQYRTAKRVKLRQPQGWFAPSYRMMGENYNQLYNILSPIVVRASQSEHRLELQGGGIIEFWSLDNFNAARGRKYAHVTVNEAAASPNLTDAWNYVIRPTLADMQGGADFGSTPKGLNGFYQIWAQAAENPDWARFHFTTYDNPYIPPSEIDAMKSSLPARVFQQEIMAEFLEDGAFFQGIEKACTVEGKDMPINHKGHRLVAGLDWALSNDFTVLRIGCATCGRTVDGLRVNKQDFTVQRLSIRDKLKEWNCPVLPERNSIGEPNIEMLEQMGVLVMRGPDGKPGFSTTATSKPELIQALAVTIEKASFLFFAEDADEMRSYEVQFTSGGHPKFSAPDGMNDDRVIANALMNWAAVSYIPARSLVSFV